MFLYSPSLNTFYPKEDIHLYKELPNDLFSVSEQVWVTYSLGVPPEGMERGCVEGCLCWVNKKAPDKAEMSNRERAWRNSELSWADVEIYKKIDNEVDFKNLSTYRKSLRDWPKDSNFPDPTYRPKRPE